MGSHLGPIAKQLKLYREHRPASRVSHRQDVSKHHEFCGGLRVGLSEPSLSLLRPRMCFRRLVFLLLTLTRRLPPISIYRPPVLTTMNKTYDLNPMLDWIDENRKEWTGVSPSVGPYVCIPFDVLEKVGVNRDELAYGRKTVARWELEAERARLPD